MSLKSGITEPPVADPKVTVQDVATVTNVPTAKSNVQLEQPTSFESPDAEAKFYRSQADKLSKEAAEMRRKAEVLAPTKKVK